MVSFRRAEMGDDGEKGEAGGNEDMDLEGPGTPIEVISTTVLRSEDGDDVLSDKARLHKRFNASTRRIKCTT